MLAVSAWHRDAFCLVAVDGVQVIGAHDDHRFWRGLGFEPDMVCLSLYRDE
jgi:hypothetical protein